MSRARFRDQRVFHVDDPAGEARGWYFEVREGAAHGPYLTRSLAEQALAGFLDSRDTSSRAQDEGGEDKAGDER